MEDPQYDHVQIHRRPRQALPHRSRLPHRPPLVHDLITAYTEPGQPYDHEAYGYVVLIEEDDVNRTLDEIWDGCTLLNIPWEGIAKRGDYFIAIYLANNEYGLCFAIPDAPWVNGELRELINDILDPVELTQEEET